MLKFDFDQVRAKDRGLQIPGFLPASLSTNLSERVEI
jgi:hypothetical protein